MDFVKRFRHLFGYLKDEKLIKSNIKKALYYLKKLEEILENPDKEEILKIHFPELLNEFYYRGGVLYFLSGDYKKALEYLKKVEGNFQFEAFYYIGSIYAELGKLSGAKRTLERIREIYRQKVTQKGFSYETRLYQTMLEDLERKVQKLEMENAVLVIKDTKLIKTDYDNAKLLVADNYIDLVNFDYKPEGINIGLEETLKRRIVLLLSLPPFRLVDGYTIKRIYRNCDSSLKSQDLKRLQKSLNVVINQKKVEKVAVTLIVPCILKLETCDGLEETTVKLCQKLSH